MTAGMRHDDLRRRNRAMVIAAVRRSDQPSRTEIAAITGLSHSTISTISSDLIAEGILTESRGGPAAPKRGRPQVAIRLAPGAVAVMTVVLSLNALSAALMDYRGALISEESRKLDTTRLTRAALVADCVEMVRRRLDTAARAGRHVLRIAFAVQGVTDAKARALLWSPITPHSEIALADVLEQAFAVPVTVENDCNMMAEALRWRHPQRYRDNFVAVLLSRGIGMGLVLNGELFSGTQSSGSEFGHMIHRPGGALCRCGRRGCVEAYAGSYAIWRSARGIAETAPPADVDDAEMAALAAAARAGAGPERAAFAKAGEALGYALGSLFALIDPAPVAIVGDGAGAFDLVEPALCAALARTAGGQHSAAISFGIAADELALIREGSAMRALTFVDREIMARGLQAAGMAGAGRQSSRMA
ncbi:MAG: ROK family protein [Mesorhizobium sp.]|nr:ROK family protein [Mesorhizobium sp.]MBN9245204.1 ROK family protein [Mesorhizobium sp.]